MTHVTSAHISLVRSVVPPRGKGDGELESLAGQLHQRQLYSMKTEVFFSGQLTIASTSELSVMARYYPSCV